MNIKENLNKVAAIKNAIDEDRLVIFAGSGVSVESGLPIWSELVMGMKDKLNFIPENLDDALKTAQILYNEKGEKEYYDIINNLIFKNSSNKPNPIHEIIFELNPQHVITTNYDTFFEEIINNKGLDFSIVVKDEDLPYGKFKNLLIKYHGDFQNHNIVLKETDFLEFSINNPLKEVFVKSLFSNKVILFVGYSFSDINLKILNQEIRHILQKHHQRTYLINTSKALSVSETNYYENIGVNIIDFTDLKKEFPKIDQILLDNSKKLSPHSNKLYSSLKLISDYNPDSIQDFTPIKDKGSILEEIYENLNEFYFFRHIPSNILEKIPQFCYKTLPNQSALLFHHGIYTTQNDDLYSLFETYDFKNDELFSESQKLKMDFIINRLLHSGIYYMQKPNKRTDSLGFSGSDVSTNINLFNKRMQPDICECISCSLSQNNYNDALQKITKYKITQNSDIFTDLIFAYACYKIEFYYESYCAYKAILVKANQQKKFEVSFLAKYNLYRLSKFNAIAYMYTLESNEIADLKNEMKDFDIDKEFFKTKNFVKKNMYEFLREIKNGVLIQRLCDDIDDKYNKFPDTKRLLEAGGSSSNSDVSNLHRACYELESFLDLNFIIGNGFSRISIAFEKSIKAFFTAYSIHLIENDNEDYSNVFGNPGLMNFNEFMISLIINHAKPSELVKIINQLSLQNIKINTEDQKNVIKLIINFFNSAFHENTHFGSDFHENELFTGKIVSDRNFRDTIEIKLKNIYIVIAFFEFTDEQLNLLMDNNNLFIQFTDFTFRKDYIYLENILANKGEKLSTEILNKLLDLLSDKNQYSTQYLWILHILKMRDSNFRTIKFDSKHFDLNNNFHEIGTLYSALDDDSRKSLIIKIEEYFDSINCHLDEYFYVIEYNIPVSTKFRKKYISYIISNSANIKNLKPNRYQQNSFINFIYLYYCRKITVKEIELIKTNYTYFQFLIDPSNFAENEFDINWLKRKKSPKFIEKYCEADYILPTIEKFLKSTYEAELAEIFFQLKNCKKKQG